MDVLKMNVSPIARASFSYIKDSPHHENLNHQQHPSHIASQASALSLSIHLNTSQLSTFFPCFVTQKLHFQHIFDRPSLITMQPTMFSSSKLAILALFALQFSAISFAHPTVEKRTPPIVMGLAKTFGAIAHTTLTSTGATV